MGSSSRTALACLFACLAALPLSAQRAAATTWGDTDAALHARPRPNVMVILADDVGWRDIDASVPTPNLDALASQGVSFRRAYVSPYCSSTRYNIMFGMHSFRDEIGHWLNPWDPSEPSVPLQRLALPEVLSSLGYRTFIAGKWHLNTLDHLQSLGISQYEAPRVFGFDSFRAGRLGNIAGSNTYFDWVSIDDGVTSQSTEYNTTAIRRVTAEWWQETDGPKFAYVAFHAPHAPFHVPPAHLLPRGYVVGPGNRGLYEAMIVALDAEIGNLLSFVDMQDTLVLFLSDNGTPSNAIAPDQQYDEVKGSVYEGGINVPLIAAGWGVPRSGVSDALIGGTDLFATILDLLGEPVPAGHAVDSQSFAPCLRRPILGARDWVYSQFFTPNGPGPYTSTGKAVVTGTDKLWITDGVEVLYDLVADPGEDSPIPPSSDPTLYGTLHAYVEAFEAQGAP